jgi:hypothetical protein
MSDQQRLRDALRNSVPDPTDEPGRGAAARRRAHSLRRMRVTLAGGVVAAVAVTGVGLWAAVQKEHPPTVSGTGKAACEELARAQGAGGYVDSRVVDGSTAVAWLSTIRTDIDPAPYRGDDSVTVCVTFIHSDYRIYVVDRSGHPARLKAGAYSGKGGVQQTMTALDRLVTGGQTTTDASFSCSGSETGRHPDVSPSLPAGATAARICFRGGYFTPPQTLTRGIPSLVRAVNEAPVQYVAPNLTCAGPDVPEYTLVFRYPRGTRSVAEETCRGLAIGQYTRDLRRHLDRRFMSLLADQVGVPPGSVIAPPCPTASGDRPEGVGDPRNVVAARYCPRGGPTDRSLPRAQLDLLRSWGRSLQFATQGEPEHTCARPSAGWPRLSLTDAWGDRFTLVLLGCGHRIYPATLSWGWPAEVIHPTGDDSSLARLARQLAGLGP